MSTKPAISIIVTVLNEEATIERLLESLRGQELAAQEIIIADGGSRDRTWQLLQAYQKKHTALPLKLVQAPGNRSVGRNAAIRQAQNQWIACTDAGCVAEPTWLAELWRQAQIGLSRDPKKNHVVAGYYRGSVSTPLTQAIIPYALVMPDRVNPEQFLPATRSMLMDKKVWEVVGGFDESLSDNEDYAFAQKIVKQPHNALSMTPRAIVSWSPPTTLGAFSRMIFRFARGDIFAGIIRPKVLGIFARYAGALLLAKLIFDFFGLNGVVLYSLISFVGYGLWSITKNIQYVPHGWYYLPILQILSDWAVMFGSLSGFVQRLFRRGNH